MSYFRAILILCTCLLLLREDLFAQEQLAKVPSQLREALMGRNASELALLLGEPDSKKTEEAEKKKEETWLYGSSKIFLERDSVVAFIDEGELMRRRASRPGAERKIRRGRSYKRQGWSNAWTHKGGVSESEVIDSIVTD